MAIILERKPPNLIQRIYLWDIIKSMAVTAKIYCQQRWTRLKHSSAAPQDPVQRIMRNQHRLVLKNDGSPLCDRCQLCAKVCPTCSIKIEESFSIDYAKCLICGTCVDACPLHAIKMDGKDGITTIKQRRDLVRELRIKN
jgi:formate hydrogenlyase subunit 6/NADH:ubiquinone oxidoreductase subunit I